VEGEKLGYGLVLPAQVLANPRGGRDDRKSVRNRKVSARLAVAYSTGELSTRTIRNAQYLGQKKLRQLRK
jgi:hypothetical protein